MQSKHGCGNAVLARMAGVIICEVMNVGECELSENIMAVNLEHGELLSQRECFYACVCYMVVKNKVHKQRTNASMSA